MNSLTLIKINIVSQEQQLSPSRCQALLLRDGGRPAWFDQLLFPLLHVLSQIHRWELPQAAESQRVQHPQQLSDDYAGLADSHAKEKAENVLIAHPTALILSEEFFVL